MTMAQSKTAFETNQDEGVAQEGLDETIVENTSHGRRRPDQKSKTVEEVVKYTHEQIDAMKIAELRETAKKLGLSSVGNKQTLRNRLEDAMEDEEDEDEDEENSDQEEDDERQDRRQRNGRRAIDTVTRQVASFTIRDVEDSLTHFSGDDKLPVDQWINDFEDTSDLLGWNELQKFIYGKRMLKGSARQFVTFERDIKSWDILKRKLIKEFKAEVNPATIHSQLFKRRQQHNESSRKYIYSMQEIANQGSIEEIALVQYIADGLQGERRDKAILYGSRTLSELKKNIIIFDKIKESTGQNMRSKRDEQKKVTSPRNVASSAVKKSHCYGCGSGEHDFKLCPDKDKGLKCFKCNSFGHIAPHCNKSDQSDKKISSVNSIHTSTDKVALKINGLSVYALLDTGSEVSVINTDIHQRIGKPALSETVRRFTGFGNVITKPIGKFVAKIDIGKDEYRTDVFVVDRSDMRDEVLLGRELLKHLDIRMNKGRVEIQRAKEESGNVTQEELIKADDGGRCESDVAINASDTDALTKLDDISRLMKIEYVEMNEVNVKEPYKIQIERLIQNYKPNTKTDARTETKITLVDDIPVCSKPRRLAPKEKKIVTQQLDEWRKEGIIRPSTSEYSSPVVVVPKKDGTYRVCIDYRRLNAKMIRDRFPMPLIEDCIDALTRAKVFSIIDLKNGFFHVRIADGSRQPTLEAEHNLGMYN